MILTPYDKMSEAEFAAAMRAKDRTTCFLNTSNGRHIIHWSCWHTTEHDAHEIVTRCPVCGEVA